MVMRNEFLHKIGDTLFAVVVAGAIGLSAANLAVQVTKERLLDAPERVDPISDLRVGAVARQGKAWFSGPSGDASVIGYRPTSQFSKGDSDDE
jgi:hypothetical protein